MIVRPFFPSLVLLLALLDLALADDGFYEEFLPPNDPNESEWTLANSMTAANVDLINADRSEYLFESNGPELPQDIASTDRGCGSREGQALNRLRPRGDDDFCGSNLGPIQLPTIIPNLSTLKLDTFCPNKFGPLASNLVCASKNPDNIKTSLFTGTSLYDAEAGTVFLLSESYVAPTQIVTIMMINSNESRGLVRVDVVLFYTCYLEVRLYCCKDFVPYSFVSPRPLDRAVVILLLKSNGMPV